MAFHAVIYLVIVHLFPLEHKPYESGICFSIMASLKPQSGPGWEEMLTKHEWFLKQEVKLSAENKGQGEEQECLPLRSVDEAWEGCFGEVERNDQKMKRFVLTVMETQVRMGTM